MRVLLVASTVDRREGSSEAAGGHWAREHGGSVALGASAQQPDLRRIGMLMTIAEDDPEAQARLAIFRSRLEQLGWTDGRNVQIDIRFAGADPDRIRRSAVQLVELAPDVILANNTAALAPLLQLTRTVPIVFEIVADPVGAGFVDSLARPGGNATGFTTLDYSISAKWLELLKEVAPGVKRVGVLRDPALTLGTAQFAATHLLKRPRPRRTA